MIKRFVFYFVVLCLLVNWMPTHAEAQGPTVAITAPTKDQNKAFDVTFTFSENVTGFTPDDVTATNATKASNWKGIPTGRTYILRLVPTLRSGTTGTVTIDVAANVATDANGNGNTAAQQVSIVVDKQRPTVSISSIPTTERNGAFTLIITFSEDVYGFSTERLRVVGIETTTAVDSVGSRADKYALTVTPGADQQGTVAVRIRAHAARDWAGNGNTPSARTSDIPINTREVPDDEVTLELKHCFSAWDDPLNTQAEEAGLCDSITLEKFLDMICNWDDDPTHQHNMYWLVAKEEYRADGTCDEYVEAPPADAPALLTNIDIFEVLQSRYIVAEPPERTTLLPNYPNPFNPETWIPYELSTPTVVSITIYDISGTVVRRLDLGFQDEGYYLNRSKAAYWDGKNEVGEPVGSGVYFYQLTTEKQSLVRKMVILK